MTTPRFTVNPFDKYNVLRGLPTRWYVSDTKLLFTVAAFDTEAEAQARADALNTL